MKSSLLRVATAQGRDDKVSLICAGARFNLSAFNLLLHRALFEALAYARRREAGEMSGA
jgi:hypothetical protein